MGSVPSTLGVRRTPVGVRRDQLVLKLLIHAAAPGGAASPVNCDAAGNCVSSLSAFRAASTAVWRILIGFGAAAGSWAAIAGGGVCAGGVAGGGVFAAAVKRSPATPSRQRRSPSVYESTSDMPWVFPSGYPSLWILGR